MTPEQRSEEISKAYVHAVAAACGFTVGGWSQDHECLDATVCGPGRRKPKIDLQVKATTQSRLVRAEHISWQLSSEHYDAMSYAMAANPHYLVVLLLPDDANESIAHDIEHLIIRKCAYWILMTGRPAATVAHPTIAIPLTQVFNPQALMQAMAAAERLEHLPIAPTPEDAA